MHDLLKRSSFVVLFVAGIALSQSADKYIWLEDVSGDKSLAWVKEHNERSAKVLQSDARFKGLESAALKVLEAPERLPYPDLNGNTIYNFWQDAHHVRGILRRTVLADYLTAQPHWTTILDYDALGKQDNEKWVNHGRSCLFPGNELCLMQLSAGGEDADTMREFNLKSAQFVPSGFVLPRSKQVVSWIDKDTLLVARDWGAGSMTKSGYPFVVKLWKRGQPLEQATEIYRGKQSDESVDPIVIHDGDGHRVTLLRRALNFFESENYLLTQSGPKKLGLPLKAEIDDLVSGQIIVTLNEGWENLSEGTVVSFDLKEAEKDPAKLKPTVIFAPTPTEFSHSVGSTKDRMILTTLDNVQGRVYFYEYSGHGWTSQKLPVGDNMTVDVVSTNWEDNKFFVQQTGFLTPSSVLLGDASTGALQPAKNLPPQFDASKDVVEQLSATSKDGTKVPYFVVRPKDLKYDGSNPTLLTAYGGFQLSSTPTYSERTGKLWLERGGVYVLANIRGGGEFGPAWHEAGLKTKRQHIYDDFYAVAQDLVARKITSSRRLGIRGGSNGGLLMGVEMTQHPEMWRAVVIDVPLLDMLRFEQIAAGSSWIGEYGSVSNPTERDFLATISPYNQLKPDVTYPEPFIFTTTKDDRVGPVHARKFAAKMEEFNKPFFYDEIIEGGHSAGADLKEQAETAAMEYTYLTRKLMD